MVHVLCHKIRNEFPPKIITYNEPRFGAVEYLQTILLLLQNPHEGFALSHRVFLNRQRSQAIAVRFRACCKSSSARGLLTFFSFSTVEVESVVPMPIKHFSNLYQSPR